MSYFRDQLETWLKTLDVKCFSVLDIGGSALPVRKRVKSWKVNEYSILDDNAELEYHPKWEYADYPCSISDGAMVSKFMKGKKFNTIFCLEVMEYIMEPLDTLRIIHTLLEKGGRLYITFPFVYPYHEPKDIDTLRYTPVGAAKMLTIAGFDIVASHKRVDRSGLLAEFYRMDGMHPAKRSDTSITGVIFECTV